MAGLDGLEIYNRHFDAKNDLAGLIAIALKLTAPATLRELEDTLLRFPDELFAAQVEYPAAYLAKWDAETKTRRLTGVAANDCHHNNVLLLKMVDENTVKLGTNVDSDDQMRRSPPPPGPEFESSPKATKKARSWRGSISIPTAVLSGM